MSKEIQELLYFVPPNADYAVDATDIDSEDIPRSRTEGVFKLLDNDDENIRFSAARLLTSWGYRTVKGTDLFKYLKIQMS